MSTVVILLLATIGLPGTLRAQASPALAERYNLDERAGRFDLPGRLDEVSGLAFTPDGRLFAHDDERARVHEVHLADESVGKRFSLGDPAEPGDFEAMEIVGDRFFLLTSTGLLYETREGAEDRSHVPFRSVDTGLARLCEAEGLALDAEANELLVACKVAARAAGRVVIHRLPITPGVRRPPPMEISTAPLEALGFGSELHPSGLTLDPATGNFVLVAAREEMLVEVDREGRILSAFQLSRNRHPQPEGIGFGPDGTLYIADEAAGRSSSRITYYRLREAGTASPGGGRP